MDHLPVLDSYEGVTAIVEYDYKAKEVDELDLVKGQIIHNIIQQPGGWWEGTLISTGRTGMFPDNFVRVLDTNDNNTVVLRDKSSTAQRRCKAIYSYTQVNEDELSLAVGDVIEFLGEVEEGWWRGKLNNKIGVFPSNFVVGMQASPVFASKRPTHAAESSTAISVNKSNTIVQKISSGSLSKSQNNFKEDVLSNNRTTATADSSSDKYTAPILPPRPVREFCRVEFPYNPQNEDELELVTGELIAIVSKELPDKGWWKGELNGKIGVFPDNFVKLLPLDESPGKDFKPIHADSTATKTTTKKTSNSNIPNPGRLESFGSRDSLDDILSETGIQSGNVAAQRKSLENKNFELTTPSSSVDRTSKHLDLKAGETRKSIENLDEKKPPPPLLTKKPTVPGKKASGVTNVAGNIISGLRQKVKNVEQKPTLSQDTNDGAASSKSNTEPLDNIEQGNGTGTDILLESELDFDKVERASILPDMRAGRVKAPKRRPPSVATNLSIEGTSRNSIYLNGVADSLDELKNPPSLHTESEQQVKPKSREWEKKKVPWISELKASQEKKKTSPNIEPRTTLVDTSTKATIEEKQNVSSIITNTNKSKIVVESNSITSNQPTVTKSTTSLFQSISTDKKIESEVDIPKSVSEVVINKTLVKESIITAEDNEVKVPPKTLPPKLNISRLQSQQTKSASSSIVGHSYESNDVITPESLNKFVELEKRVHSLEAVVQAQQKTIDDLKKLLHDESDRVEMLKNQLEKYAQCVTQV